MLGFDDAPFVRTDAGGAPASVNIAGVVCEDAVFEGMLWNSVTEDGWDASETVIEAVESSKFHDQIHAVLFDGIAFAGFNVLDLPRIAEALELPCCTVMRRQPSWSSIRDALENVDRGDDRYQRMKDAGTVMPVGEVYMQICGSATATLWRRAMPRLTREGHIPEAIRLAHLIANAVVTGESGRRA